MNKDREKVVGYKYGYGILNIIYMKWKNNMLVVPLVGVVSLLACKKEEEQND